jgi:hypothetical protein
LRGRRDQAIASKDASNRAYDGDGGSVPHLCARQPARFRGWCDLFILLFLSNVCERFSEALPLVSAGFLAHLITTRYDMNFTTRQFGTGTEHLTGVYI